MAGSEDLLRANIIDTVTYTQSIPIDISQVSIEENPFRDGGEISKDADEIITYYKQGKLSVLSNPPLDELTPSSSTLLPQDASPLPPDASPTPTPGGVLLPQESSSPTLLEAPSGRGGRDDSASPQPPRSPSASPQPPPSHTASMSRLSPQKSPQDLTQSPNNNSTDLEFNRDRKNGTHINERPSVIEVERSIVTQREPCDIQTVVIPKKTKKCCSLM
eukprot:TRINITY_DN12934_c0_g1_i1.p1 TRINITY_DN12934_c0_g1~~TRINITY_DN12934_c0_g1_i1.p1  ORF type:complete len:218 (+),score=26.94 TRINITY_DN12934_c0_g1_i1:57-710(+)